MPTKPEGVYQDTRGAWYFKVTVGRDALTGRREQITRRGFRTAGTPPGHRGTCWPRRNSSRIRPALTLLSVGELMDLYRRRTRGERRPRRQDPVRLPAQHRGAHPAVAGRTPGPRRHPGGDSHMAAQARPGWGKQDRQAVGAEHHPPGPGAAGRCLQAGGLERDRRRVAVDVDAPAKGPPVDPQALVTGASPGVPRVDGWRPDLPRLGVPARFGSAHR
jgi:Arm DNA-binding domain